MIALQRPPPLPSKHFTLFAGTEACQLTPLVTAFHCSTVPENSITFRDEQPEKAQSPIFKTVAGIVTDESALQLKNAAPQISVTFSGTTMDSSDLQAANAFSAALTSLIIL